MIRIKKVVIYGLPLVGLFLTKERRSGVFYVCAVVSDESHKSQVAFSRFSPIYFIFYKTNEEE